ncbi:MmgE/PrpD family protein [Amycolatopsis jejuensis]|uniref:MmgE/PrpD family protein n=1 Tax=Amycolatopsis jejuensis TaxID=330084 RepID=UPI000525CD96|nr:MmgE/PrpD family protein [Amycolatopsis jejuensis]
MEHERRGTSSPGSIPVAREFARLMVETSFKDLPEQAVDYAAMLVASTIASSAFGTTIRSAQVVRDLVWERRGAEQASVWFEAGTKLSLVDAVRLNAVRSSAAASDDSDLRNIVHAGTPATTAALAVGEREGASGEDVLAAIALGYEAAARVGASITPGYKQRGFHGCIAAIFASTVASGRLLRLDEDRMTHAIALAATTISGFVRAADVSTAREHHDSMAATLGTEAALAAGHGFTVDDRVFERAQGYFEVFGQTTEAAGRTAMCAGFGTSWAIVDFMAIKLIPGGHPFHAGAEAAAAVVRQAGITPADITSIEVAAPGLKELVGPRHPVDLVQMAHSQAYFVAAGAADGEFSWGHASGEKIADPEIHRLIDLIRVDPAPCELPERYRQGATVTVHTRDGRSASATVFEPAGSGAQGISWNDVDAKYRALVPLSGLGGGAVDASLAEIHRLAELPDVLPLTRSLVRNA